MYIRDTIYGLATVHGRSGVAIIRISGKNAFDAIRYFGIEKEVPDRVATFCKIYDTSLEEKALLDECLAFKFSAPNSFTGENVLEFHLHGSISVIKDTLELLQKMEGFRVAEPGEFSKRAFYNEKLDLTRAEGLALLIDSETTKQREVALNQLSGSLEGVYEMWRKQIIFAIALLESLIDFPEEDIPQAALQEALSSVSVLAKQIKNHLKTAHKGRSIMEGIKVPIIGPPNAGKSSLLNRLAGEDIAITSEVAGTTRDVISVKVNINGYCVVLKDTAGIRDAKDEIEKQGVERALLELKKSDISIVMLEPENLDLEMLKILDKNCILVVNKIDNKKDMQKIDTASFLTEKYDAIYISAKNDLNVNKVIDAIGAQIAQNFSTSETLITKLRYEEKLQECYSILSAFDPSTLLDLAAQDLRHAASCIDEITGRIDIEEVIDVIFSTFCIGK